MAALLWLVVLVGLAAGVLQIDKPRRRTRSIGSAAAGSVYDLLNEDRRRALEIIVERRAEARDPEDRDGNLPDLANPKG